MELKASCYQPTIIQNFSPYNVVSWYCVLAFYKIYLDVYQYIIYNKVILKILVSKFLQNIIIKYFKLFYSFLLYFLFLFVKHCSERSLYILLSYTFENGYLPYFPITSVLHTLILSLLYDSHILRCIARSTIRTLSTLSNSKRQRKCCIKSSGCTWNWIFIPFIKGLFISSKRWNSSFAVNFMV